MAEFDCDVGDAPAGQPGHRQGGDADHPGQCAHRHVPVAEHADPGVQQQVVQRRGAVVPQRGEHRPDRAPRDLHGQGLVEPQLAAGGKAQYAAERDDQHHSTGLPPAGTGTASHRPGRLAGSLVCQQPASLLLRTVN